MKLSGRRHCVPLSDAGLQVTRIRCWCYSAGVPGPGILLNVRHCMTPGPGEGAGSRGPDTSEPKQTLAKRKEVMEESTEQTRFNRYGKETWGRRAVELAERTHTSATPFQIKTMAAS